MKPHYMTLGFLLNIFYVSLKHVWPQNYFGLSGSVDPIISRNLVRWTVFRFVPPVIAAAAASLTAQRAAGFPLVAAAFTIALHVGRLIKPTIQAVRRRYWSAFIYYALLISILLLAMGLATVGRNIFSPVVPEPKELVANIWAGFLAAIGAIYLQRVVLLRKKPRDLMEQSFDEIPLKLRVYAWRKARAAGIDPRIPLAIMSAENLQRPSWVRQLERLVPRRLGGTRGIMQQSNARSDIDSIDLAFTHYFTDQNTAGTHLSFTHFSRYNNDKNFISLAASAFSAMEEDSSILAKIEHAARVSNY
jgi:hypothetical protein